MMMKRFARCAAACLLLSGATTALAKDLEVSSLETKRPVELGNSLQKQRVEEERAGYIVDVSGKRVRLVGPRFYPESNDDIQLIGRRDALQREAARLEASLPPSGNE